MKSFYEKDGDDFEFKLAPTLVAKDAMAAKLIGKIEVYLPFNIRECVKIDVYENQTLLDLFYYLSSKYQLGSKQDYQFMVERGGNETLPFDLAISNLFKKNYQLYLKHNLDLMEANQMNEDQYQGSVSNEHFKPWGRFLLVSQSKKRFGGEGSIQIKTEKSNWSPAISLSRNHSGCRNITAPSDDETKKSPLYQMSIVSYALEGILSNSTVIRIAPRYILSNYTGKRIYLKQGTSSLFNNTEPGYDDILLSNATSQSFHWYDAAEHKYLCIRFDEDDMPWSGCFILHLLGSV